MEECSLYWQTANCSWHLQSLTQPAIGGCPACWHSTSRFDIAQASKRRPLKMSSWQAFWMSLSQKEHERISQFTLHHLEDTEQQTILPAAVKALCERHQVFQNCDAPDLSCSQPTMFESPSLSAGAVPQGFQQRGCSWFSSLSPIVLRGSDGTSKGLPRVQHSH